MVGICVISMTYKLLIALEQPMWIRVITGIYLLLGMRNPGFKMIEKIIFGYKLSAQDSSLEQLVEN